MITTGAMTQQAIDNTEPPENGGNKAGASFASARRDLMDLTKARLSLLVLSTTLCGYLAAAKSAGNFSWGVLFHTLFGTLLAAAGAAVYNQLMEMEADARMYRTANRPLPSGRIPAPLAFTIGFLLAAFGIVHLAMKVNNLAALFCAATLLSYLFIYTPMKRRSGWNTVVGAVSGALPPLIGWAAGDGLIWSWGAAFLFLLLFLWQLPHFVAINWMYREEYEHGGFVMWSNQDISGARTARLALIFSGAVLLLPVLPVVTKVTGAWFLFPGLLAGGQMFRLAWRFYCERERSNARSLFLYTLIYLPVMLAFALVAWI